MALKFTFLIQVKGMALNKGMALGPREERESAGSSDFMQITLHCYVETSFTLMCFARKLLFAKICSWIQRLLYLYVCHFYANGNLCELMADDLRMAVKEVICDNNNERHQYEEALIAITIEDSLRRWGLQFVNGFLHIGLSSSKWWSYHCKIWSQS